MVNQDNIYLNFKQKMYGVEIIKMHREEIYRKFKRHAVKLLKNKDSVILNLKYINYQRSSVIFLDRNRREIKKYVLKNRNGSIDNKNKLLKFYLRQRN